MKQLPSSSNSIQHNEQRSNDMSRNVVEEYASLLHSKHSAVSYDTLPNNNDNDSQSDQVVIVHDRTDGNKQRVQISKRSEKMFRLVSRGNAKGHFNVNKVNIPILQKLKTLRDSYHVLLNVKWWKLFSGFFLFYLLIHLVFGLLYYLGGKHALENTDYSYMECVFFSVQTFSTIGYGKVYPSSYYANSIVCLESFVSLFAESFVISLVIGKFTRPSLLKRQIIYSKVAVINNINAEGAEDPEHDYISFRFMGVHKSQFVDAHFRLLLLKWEYEDDQGEQQLLGNSSRPAKRRIPLTPIVYELDFQINVQRGVARTIDHASPILPLPWLVVHKIDSASPFYGILDDKGKMKRLEMVAIYDAIDEATSHNLQSRFSYTSNEMIRNAKFANCVYRSKNKFVVDYDDLDQIVPLERN